MQFFLQRGRVGELFPNGNSPLSSLAVCFEAHLKIMIIEIIVDVGSSLKPLRLISTVQGKMARQRTSLQYVQCLERKKKVRGIQQATHMAMHQAKTQHIYCVHTPHLLCSHNVCVLLMSNSVCIVESYASCEQCPWGRHLTYALHDTYRVGVSLRGEICGASAQLSYLVYLIKIQRYLPFHIEFSTYFTFNPLYIKIVWMDTLDDLMIKIHR